jgi:hypothetical protein
MAGGGQRYSQSLYAQVGAPVPTVQEAVWASGTVWTGAENLAHTGIRSPGCPVRSKSLYRLRCPKCEQQALLNFRNLKGLYKTSAFVLGSEMDVTISTKRCCLHEFIVAAVDTNTVCCCHLFCLFAAVADIHNCHT